jgi:hypothetical protein
MGKDEALKLALRMCDEALPKFNWGASFLDANAIQLLNTVPAAIKAALEQPVQPAQEPVAWISPGGHIHYDPYLDSVPLYKAPQQRPWVGLTDEEMHLNRPNWLSPKQCKKWVQQIEQALQEKNNGA